MSYEISDSPLRELLAATGATRTGAGSDTFRSEAPDWFGDRVFGGVAAAQAIAAAAQTVEAPRRAHSMHAFSLGPLRPGRVAPHVGRLGGGPPFPTRHISSNQN